MFPSISMKTDNSHWNKMVHVPFKKVVKFDLICLGIGDMIGIGAGVYLVASGFLV